MAPKRQLTDPDDTSDDKRIRREFKENAIEVIEVNDSPEHNPPKLPEQNKDVPRTVVKPKLPSNGINQFLPDCEEKELYEKYIECRQSLLERGWQPPYLFTDLMAMRLSINNDLAKKMDTHFWNMYDKREIYPCIIIKIDQTSSDSDKSKHNTFRFISSEDLVFPTCLTSQDLPFVRPIQLPEISENVYFPLHCIQSNYEKMTKEELREGFFWFYLAARAVHPRDIVHWHQAKIKHITSEIIDNVDFTSENELIGCSLPRLPRRESFNCQQEIGATHCEEKGVLCSRVCDGYEQVNYLKRNKDWNPWTGLLKLSTVVDDIKSHYGKFRFNSMDELDRELHAVLKDDKQYFKSSCTLKNVRNGELRTR